MTRPEGRFAGMLFLRKARWVGDRWTSGGVVFCWEHRQVSCRMWLVVQIPRSARPSPKWGGARGCWFAGVMVGKPRGRAPGQCQAAWDPLNT